MKEAIVAAKATRARAEKEATGAIEESNIGEAAQRESREAGRTATTGESDHEDIVK